MGRLRLIRKNRLPLAGIAAEIRLLQGAHSRRMGAGWLRRAMSGLQPAWG